MQILFIQTGGTIDKDYPTHGKSYAFEIASPAIERIMKTVRPSFSWRSLELLKKDSSDITDDDRQTILQACRDAPEKHIIITHGTDTMHETSQILATLTDKVIVITGSFRPERFAESDASFNVGMAIGGLQILKPGVYIAMSGVLLSWDKVYKNFGQGQYLAN